MWQETGSSALHHRELDSASFLEEMEAGSPPEAPDKSLVANKYFRHVSPEQRIQPCCVRLLLCRAESS